MRELTEKHLLEAGWFKGRKISLKSIEEVYKKHGFTLIDYVKKFFEEFGMLDFEFQKKGSPFNTTEVVRFNPSLAIGKTDNKEYFDSISDDYSDVQDLENVDFYPLGETDRGNMILMMGSNGKLFGYTDGCLVKYGDTTDEMLDCVIGQYSIGISYDD